MKPIIILWLFAASIYGQNVMSVPDYSGRFHDTIAIDIKINNVNNFVAFQTDVVLPTQVTYIPNSAVLTGRSNGHTISATLLPNNVLRILAFSINQSPFVGDTGSVVKFKVKLKTEPGSYPVELINPIISNATSTNILTSFTNGSVTIVSPKINLSPSQIDFGRIPLWNSTDQNIYIQNIGNSDLVIERIYTGNEYFQIIGDTTFTIGPWGDRVVTVRFNSLKKGTYNTNLKIQSNDPTNNIVIIPLTAVAFAVNELHAQPAFGRSGFPVDVSFSINNMEPITGFQFDIVTPNALNFIRDSIFLSSRKQDHVINANYISPNRLRVIAFSPTNKYFIDSLGNILRIKFDLNGTGGDHYYNLENVIISDNSANNVMSAYYTSYVNIASPDIQGSSDIIFGEVSVKDTTIFGYQIFNYGNDTLKISSITSNNTSFWTDFASPVIIPQYSSAILNTYFHNNQKGSYTGRLAVRSNDPDTDPFYINLSAVSFTPNYISAANTSGLVNDTAGIGIHVENHEQFVAFQVDLVVPDGIVYIPNSARLTDRKVDHMVSVANIGNNTFRIVAFSPTQQHFQGINGEVVKLDFTTGNSIGSFPLTLVNGILSNAVSQNIIRGTRDGTLTTFNRPAKPVLVSPSNNSTNISRSPLLTWSLEPNSNFYSLQFATDSLFIDTLFTIARVYETQYQIYNLSFNSKYFWRVKGYNNGGDGDWSDASSFTTLVAGPLVPVLASPLNNSKGLLNPISFSWYTTQRAERYELQVSTDITFNNLIVHDTTLTDTIKVLAALSEYTHYYWRVKAFYTGVVSDWSTVWNFKTLGNPYASNLITPFDASVNQSVTGLTFKWTKAKERIESIQKYQFQISTDSLFTTTFVNDSTLTDTTKIVSGMGYLTNYFWRVRAQNQTGWGDWSNTWRFTTIIEKPTVPALALPVNGSNGLLNPITAKWNKSLRVEKYELQVSTDSLFASFIVNDSTLTDTTKLLPTLANYSQYYWRVKAVNVGGESEWSSVWSFKTLGNPYATNLIEPLNSSVNHPLSGLTFKWTKAQERIETIQKYQLQISNDSLFGTLFVNDSTLIDTSKIVNGMSYLTKYFWRVRAQNQTGWGDWSETWKFTTIIEKPTVPVLVAPANNSNGLLNLITAKWNKSLRVEKYKLQVSTNNLFTSFIVNDTTLTDTTKLLPNLANYSQYYWRVKAINVGGESDWSTVWNFKTLGNPYASNLLTPLDASINQPLSGLTFKWSKALERIETIQKYQLQISNDSLFGTLFVNDSTLVDTSRIVNGMGYLTKYFWRVRAQNQTGWGDWSNTWRFTTIIEKPTVPVLAAPANNSNGLLNPITAKWNKSLRVEKYKLQISTNSLFTSFVVNDTTLTDTTKIFPNLANYSQYYWRVKAVNVGGESDWSDVWNFKTLGNPYASNLIAPLDNSVNHPLNGLTFKWSKAKERIETIQKYQFQLSTDSLFLSFFLNDSTLTDTLLVLNELDYLTKYFWRVRAQNQTGWGDWSETWRFSTIIEKPTIPVLALPSNDSLGLPNPVTTIWKKSLRVEKYILQVSTGNLFASFILNDSTITDTTRLLPNLANYSQYYWRVKAVNIGGESDWSTVWNFKTLGNPLATTLIEPFNRSVNHPLDGVTFKWEKALEEIESIQKYQFQLSADSLFRTTLQNDSTLSELTKVVGGLEYLTNYFWRVRAKNQAGWGDWSETWKFTTIIEKPTIPILAFPLNNSKGLPNPVTAGWNNSVRSEKYILQVSPDNLFTSLVVNDSTLTDTSVLITNLADYTQYYWRVKAVNAGGESDWSTVWNFNTLGNPYATNLIEPVNNSINQAVSGLTIKWYKTAERIESIQQYQLQISTDSLFGSLFLNDATITDTSRIVSGLNFLSKYFWRVRAQNQTGWGDWSNTWRFTTIIEKPTVPYLTSPIDQSKGLLNPVTVMWSKSERVERYKLQVSGDNLFTSFMLNDSTLSDSTHVLPNLTNYSNYYWRVKAVNVGGESEWSTIWNFKTLGNPYASTPLLPANQTVNLPINGLTFNWTKALERIETIQKYQLQISTDSLFGTLFVNDSTLIDTSKIVNGMSYLTKYFWRVRAQNQTGWGDWSETWKFTTIIEKPTVPVLVAPANNSNGLLNLITAKWNKSLRVEKYKLQVATNSLFTSFVVNDTTLTDTTKLLPNLANYSQHYWRVKAVNVGGESEWSSVWSFKTLGNPYASNLLTPLDASINQPLSGLTFKWSKALERIETIQKYQLQISNDSLFGTLFVNDSTLIDTSKIVNGMSYLTKYFWRVRAQNQTGWGDWSNTWRFTTIIEKPTVPVLAAPANNSNGLLNPITAKWNKSLRVEKYKLQISTNSLFTSFVVNDTTLTDTTKIFPNLANYSQYYWRVKAVNVGGESDWSSVWNFKTLGIPYASNLSTPLDASVNQSVTGLTFKWTKAKERIESIQKYQFQISTDSLITTTFVNDSTLTDTTKIVSGMGYLINYFWRVRAQNQTGWGDWSETWKFTTIIEKPTIPVLATPLNNSKGLLNPISAKWNKSLRVEKYKLQVSTDSLFASFIVNDSTLTDTTKLFPTLANYSQYYWRVKAINVGGESDWSTVWNFKTLGNSYASNLLTPLDASVNQSVTGLTFKWTKAKERIESIQKYQFQISTDSLFATVFVNDSTLTDTMKVVGGMGYLTKYFWRVRAQNQTGWGDWSDTWRFTTIIEKPTIPILAIPLNNSQGLLNPIAVKWNKSLRVEKYELQVSTDSLLSSLIYNDTTLTDTTAILPNLSNYTKYYWRVKAVNVGGESDWSTVWNFKTLGNPNATNLIMPFDASVNQPLNSLTFKWNKASEQVETNQTYQFQLSTDSSFASSFINDSTLTDTTKIVNGFSYLTKYFWKVRAKNQTGWGDWSETWRFTTIIEKPTIPILAFPLNNSKGLPNPVTAGWHNSVRSEKYILQVSPDNLFTSLVVNDSTLTDTSVLITNLADYTQYYWRVKAVNGGGESDWSSVWNFKTLGNPYSTNLIEPVNNSVNQAINSLSIKWYKTSERIETIQRYQLQLSTDSLFASYVVKDTTTTDTTKVLNDLQYLTDYYWRVRAQNQTGWGDWSDTWRFTTIIEKPTSPFLISPSDQSKGLLNPITVMWSKSERVERYKLQVSGDNLFTSFMLNDSTLSDSTHVLPNLTNYSNYYWRVKAVNVGGESEWSTIWNFKTLGNPYASTPLLPANQAVNLPINGLTFKWTKAQERIETIQKYQFQVSTDSLFGSFFINDTTLTDTLKMVNGLSYLTKYFWRVRAQNQTGWGDWSNTWQFTSIIEKPTIPVLATPMNNSLSLLNPITANWNKSLRVEKYKLQVSTNNLFTSFILNDSTLTDTTKLLPNLANYSQYYWRVKAVNVGGESDWSTVWNFKTLGNPYASNLSTPLDASVNQSVTGLTFKWTKAQERIETIQKYQLQISTDSLFGNLIVNDSTLSDTSRIVNGMGYLTKYFWRVRAQNQTGWGDWSATWKFTTIIEKPTVPVLAAPLNNSLGLLNPITAKWNKSLRVEKYKLQVSTNNLFTSFIVNDSTLTDTTKLFPNLANYSQYYWRVKAINVGGESDWSTFWNFKTLGNPYASNLSTPLDASVNQPLNGLTFKWTKAKERIETIQKYQLQISSDSLFGSFFINDTTLTDTARIVNGMGYLTKYFWRVRAQNQTGWGDWSETRKFTTIIEKPTIPVLANPLNDSKGLLNPITAKWNKSLRVEKYKLQVSSNNLFTSFMVNDSTITDTTRLLPNLANYSQYYWRVKAVNVGGESDWSTVWNFKTLGNPYASNLLTPLDASINQPLSGLTFKWSKALERIETIQKYQFQVSTDSLFATTFVNDSTLTDTTKVVGGMGYLTKYFWRVRAQNQTGWGDWSATWKFTTIIEKPTIPVLATPLNDSKGLLNPIAAKWNKSLRVEKYKLQVSTNNLFTSFIVNDSTITDTTKVLPNLTNYYQYYWRVKAVNVGGESDWSNVWNFKTLGNPYASNLVVPLNNTLNHPLNGIIFKWTKPQERIETIQKYQLQISSDSLFGSFFINDTTLTDTARIVNGMGFYTKYFWRVRAQNQTGWGDWSESWKFTTIIEKPTVPVLYAPSNNSNGLLNPITAKWYKSTRVEKYKLQVSSNNLFTSFIVNDSTLTDTTKLLPNLANYSQYYWRVKAVNVGGESDWSTVWNFKTLGNPYASNLLTPLDASVNQPVAGLTFKWTKAQERIESIQKYQLQISIDSLFASTFVNDSTLTDTTKVVGGMGYLTKYFWRIRAQNQTGWGDWSTTWQFTTTIEIPTIPVLALPVNGDKGLMNPITAKWNKSLRVEKYKLQMSNNNLFSSLIVNDSLLTDTTRLLPNLNNYTQYYWRVKAVNVGGESDWSTVWNFKTLGNPYASNLIEPLNSSVNHPLNGLTFKWTKATERIETIQKYQFQISTDSLFASTFVSDSTLTDTTKVVGGMGYLTKYFWRVRAQNQTGWGDWSEIWKFTTIIDKPTIPVLATPLNDSKGLLNPISAKWNQSLRVEKYKLQVSTDNLFSSLIVNDSTLTDTMKLLPNLANYSQYYWRVKAVNVGGESDWSTVWNFKTLGNPYASNLLIPLDASVNQPVAGLTFEWTKAQERIESIQKYQIQIATDSLFGSLYINDSTLTDTSRIVSGLSHQSKYYWRVRAQNEISWGDWSETWSFTTIIEKPTVPVLALPFNNSNGLLNPITAKWNKSLRVEKYKLQVSTDSLFGSLIVNDSTIVDTTKMLLELANYTKYFWRAKAVNICGESDWSMVWNFKTLGNPYASNLVEPLNNSQNHSLNDLTFKWNKAQERIETIQKYQFQISTDSLFASTFVNDSTLTDTSKVVGGMGFLTKYFWRVRAQNQTGWGDWSETWKFTTIIEKPTIPVLATPLNESKGLLNPITVKWNKSLRVEKYKLQVSTDSLFGSLIINDSTLTDTTKLLPELANYSKYFWRVKAVNIGGESDWSTVWNFKTLGNPYSVILASPENGAVNNPVNSVTFKWFKPQERVETILKYHFQLSTDSLFGSISFSDSTFILDTTTTGSGLTYLTTYFWRVRAKNETGWGDWSQVWNLTTIIDKPSIPLLVSPANNVTQLLQPVVLKWRQSLRVEKYTLELSENPNFTTLFLVDSTLTDTMRTLPQLQNAKTWYWRVKAKNIGGSSEYSSVWNFRTLGLPLTVNLIAPSNGSVNIPVNDVLLQWSTSGEQTLGAVTSGRKSIKKAKSDEESVGSSVGNNTPAGGNLFASGNVNTTSGIESIGNYWLEIKTDTSNTTLFYSDSTLTDTTKLMSGFVFQSTYFWRVKANNEVGWGSFSGWNRFTTQKKPISSPTELTATATAVKRVTLSWSDNSDNELGFIILRKTGDSTSAALLERIDSVGVDVTGFVDTTVTDTTYYSYKVMAYNADTLSEQSNYVTVFTLTGIKEFSSDIPKEFSLYQNYPNPFNPSTIIRFALPKDAHVEIELYSIQGELMKKLVSEDKQAGYYEISLEIPSYASGIYFYRIVASPGDKGEPFVQTRKFILMK